MSSRLSTMDQLFVNMPSSIHAPPQTPLPLLTQPNPSWNAVLEQDEYEDDMADYHPSSSKKGDKQVRRRSSKACDQCRKSKCKCERSASPDEPCKNCVLLGTPCTFLGPSRKRGPPKGYIDAIESRLHQMEALLGMLLSSNDPRVRSILDDLAGDALARDILQKVDESPFGTRNTSGGSPLMEDRAARILRTSVPVSAGVGPGKYASPSVEWQEHLKDRLKRGAERSGLVWEEEDGEGEGRGVAVQPVKHPNLNGRSDKTASSGPPKLSLDTALRRTSHANLAALSASHERGESPRQRRRIGDSSSPQLSGAVTTTTQARSKTTPSLSPTSPSMRLHSHSHTPSSPSSDSSDDELLASAVGQLSLNEDSQVRYHGPLSGLHILGLSDRLDKRNEGGLWRFPKAGVWPRASRPRRNEKGSEWEVEWEVRRRVLPSLEEQVEMLHLYWGYVHPVLPMLDREAFWRAFRGEPDPDTSKSSPSPPLASSESLANSSRRGECRVSTLLLLAMFAIAARYKTEPADPIPMNENEMWNAGDEYLEGAKSILNQTYALSRPSTCQALLLLSYREIGIGAMAQAWLYTGMAVRMAQDLGMHRSADKWQRTGSELFSEQERQVRKRIWYSCVIMDKYVSTYIGRPLSIFDRDFDTTLPAEDPKEEMMLWTRHASPCAGGEIPDTELPSLYVPVSCRPIASFNACAKLSGILSNIVESIYSVQPPMNQSRHQASVQLDKMLDKWYLELPEYLQLPTTMLGVSNANASHGVGEGNGSSSGEGGGVKLPPAHVLTLHMMYWCSVLLLHRPFIRRKIPQVSSNNSNNNDGASPGERDKEKDEVENMSSQKAFELCAMAATKISNIVVLYQQNFCIRRCPAFFTYYVFSAGIMHMTALWVRPSDIQAARGLQQCMDALQTVRTLWPSAGRAWELLIGAKVEVHEIELSRQANGRDKRKRTMENEREREPEQHQEIVLTQPSASVYTNGHGHTHADGVRENGNGAELLHVLSQSQQTSSLPPLTSLQPHISSNHPHNSQHHVLPPLPPSLHHHPHPNPHPYAHAHTHNLPGATASFQPSSWASSSDFSTTTSGPYVTPASNELASYHTTHFDSPKADLWKDFPDQFGVGDSSLITSSLYGLPVISSAGTTGALAGVHGHAAPSGVQGMNGFMGVSDFPGIYGMQDGPANGH